MKSGTARIALVLLVACGFSAAQPRPIDVSRSAIVIHVFKAGLFSAAGHEHWVDAPISSGTIDESAQTGEFTVETARMTVRPDPKVDAKTQAQIQKDMDELTLNTREYPQITFRSRSVESSADGWRITGELTLHGVTKAIRLDASKQGDAYVARTTLKQTDYRIKPISVAGGTVKVKDEIELEFHIVPRSS
ncbi:MAG TPA: YceI family protein [Bryobacteraceae bacterium]|nr:YceI family protein [Bryobacteraceae bacterium]